MAVLGHLVLGNIHAAHDLQAGDDGVLQVGGHSEHTLQQTVNTHTHSGFFFKRFDVNITCPCFDRTLDQAVQKADDRRFIIVVVQIFDFQFIHRTSRGETDICLFCCFSGTDFCKIIRNRLFQRCFFTQ